MQIFGILLSMAKLKASIDFGLVHIPVEMVSAEDRKDQVSFHMFDSKDKSRIRLKRVNENTGREVEWEDIIKGYEVKKDKYVFFTEEELDALEEESNRSLAIDVFIEKEEISPELFETPYYIIPGKGGEKGYAILQKVLESTEKYAVVQAVFRNREKLGVIYSNEGALLLGMLRYPEEVKQPSEVLPASAARIKVTDKEINMAEQLLTQMSGRFKPKNYKDEYVDKIKAAVKKKVRSKGARKATEAQVKRKGKGKKTIDIMELLANSIKSKKGKSSQKRKRA